MADYDADLASTLIPNDDARHLLAQVLNDASPVALITGPTGIGKSEKIPGAVVAMQKVPRRVVCVQHRRQKASTHVAFVNGRLLAYVSYRWMATKSEHVDWIHDVGVIILDDFHTQSIDQELAWIQLQNFVRLHSKSPKIILMTAYPESGCFENRQLSWPGEKAVPTPNIIYYFAQLQKVRKTNRPPATHEIYLDPSHALAQGSCSFLDWALELLQNIEETSRPLSDFRAVVFVPSRQDATALKSKLSEVSPEVVVHVLGHDVDYEAVDKINSSYLPVVVIMQPYFTSRIPIYRVKYVLCSGTTERKMMNNETGKDELVSTRLSTLEIKFLSSHGRAFKLPPTTREVYHGFTLPSKPPENTVPSSTSISFTMADCSEYLLRTAAILPPLSKCDPVVPFHRPRLLSDKGNISWSYHRLNTLGLLEETQEGSEIVQATDLGRRVAQLMGCTRLNLESSMFLVRALDTARPQQTESKQYHHIAVMISVLSSLESPLLEMDPPPDDGKPNARLTRADISALRALLCRDSTNPHLIHTSDCPSLVELNGVIWAQLFCWLLVRGPNRDQAIVPRTMSQICASSQWNVCKEQLELAGVMEHEVKDYLGTIGCSYTPNTISDIPAPSSAPEEIDYFYNWLDGAWLYSNFFNIVYVDPLVYKFRPPNPATEKDNSPHSGYVYYGKDICSALNVRLDLKSVLNIEQCLQLNAREAETEKPLESWRKGVWLAYGDIYRINNDELAKYEVSSLWNIAPGAILANPLLDRVPGLDPRTALHHKIRNSSHRRAHDSLERRDEYQGSDKGLDGDPRTMVEGANNSENTNTSLGVKEQTPAQKKDPGPPQHPIKEYPTSQPEYQAEQHRQFKTRQPTQFPDQDKPQGRDQTADQGHDKAQLEAKGQEQVEHGNKQCDNSKSSSLDQT